MKRQGENKTQSEINGSISFLLPAMKDEKKILKG